LTLAEIYGKISSNGSNLTDKLEDLLTSDVFGTCRYLEPNMLLIPFLSSAKNLKNEFLSVEFIVEDVFWNFWPQINPINGKTCEPDVVIGLVDADENMHLIMVESKLYSGKSSFEGDIQNEMPTDQLAKEYFALEFVSLDDLGWDVQNSIVERKLVYITADTEMPRLDILDSITAYKKVGDSEIFWTSWRFLPKLVDSIIADIPATNKYNKMLLEDLITLLKRKQLTMFEGISRIETIFKSMNFYRSGFVGNTYKWEIPDLMPENFEFYRVH
jgi:hypothetical protein